MLNDIEEDYCFDPIPVGDSGDFRAFVTRWTDDVHTVDIDYRNHNTGLRFTAIADAVFEEFPTGEELEGLLNAHLEDDPS